MGDIQQASFAYFTLKPQVLFTLVVTLTNTDRVETAHWLAISESGIYTFARPDRGDGIVVAESFLRNPAPQPVNHC